MEKLTLGSNPQSPNCFSSDGSLKVFATGLGSRCFSCESLFFWKRKSKIAIHSFPRANRSQSLFKESNREPLGLLEVCGPTLKASGPLVGLPGVLVSEWGKASHISLSLPIVVTVL